jgi:kynurenine formamidase
MTYRSFFAHAARLSGDPPLEILEHFRLRRALSAIYPSSAWSHTGTHIDAPAIFSTTGKPLKNCPWSALSAAPCGGYEGKAQDFRAGSGRA